MINGGKPQEWQSISSTAPITLTLQGNGLVVGVEKNTQPGTYSSVTVDEWGRVTGGTMDTVRRLYIANNTSYSFKPEVDGGVLLVGGSYLSSRYCDIVKFHTTSPSSVESLLFKAGENVRLYDEPLTGKTGGNGNINVSAYKGMIYLENRTGAPQYIFAKVMV